jgi:hypothetical protein
VQRLALQAVGPQVDVELLRKKIGELEIRLEGSRHADSTRDCKSSNPPICTPSLTQNQELVPLWLYIHGMF